jgi:glyoxylase-like metal-dependent hydrolase (beta-lactamase superfamily II)
MVNDLSRRGYEALNYQFADQIPAPGEFTEIADGVLWVRMPMPGRLNHINVWLLRDNDGWTIVDTGLNRKDVQNHWQHIFDNHLDGMPITRVIATHLRPHRECWLDYAKMGL